jgi:hypothetical protein
MCKDVTVQRPRDRPNEPDPFLGNLHAIIELMLERGFSAWSVPKSYKEEDLV